MLNPIDLTAMVPIKPRQKLSPAGVRIPPGWKDVLVATTRGSSVQVVGFDSKGRRVYLYSPTHVRRATSSKFNRLKSFTKALPGILQKIENGIKRNREEALVLHLIYKTGFRIGSDVDTNASKKAYGATTLLGKHVRLDGPILNFDFIGKKGVRIETSLEDPILASKLKLKGSEKRIFKVSDGEVRQFLYKISPKFVVKDFRTYLGTKTAIDTISNLSVPTNLKELKKAKKFVATSVAEKLGNTPGTALGSYIAPEVFSEWEASVKGEA